MVSIFLGQGRIQCSSGLRYTVEETAEIMSLSPKKTRRHKRFLRSDIHHGVRAAGEKDSLGGMAAEQVNRNRIPSITRMWNDADIQCSQDLWYLMCRDYLFWRDWILWLLENPHVTRLKGLISRSSRDDICFPPIHHLWAYQEKKPGVSQTSTKQHDKLWHNPFSLRYHKRYIFTQVY